MDTRSSTARNRDPEAPSTAVTVVIATLVIASAVGSAIMAYLVQG